MHMTHSRREVGTSLIANDVIFKQEAHDARKLVRAQYLRNEKIELPQVV